MKELLQMFQKDSDYVRRGFEDCDGKDEVNSLVSKSNGLLLSLVEGNKDAEIALFLN